MRVRSMRVSSERGEEEKQIYSGRGTSEGTSTGRVWEVGARDETKEVSWVVIDYTIHKMDEYKVFILTMYLFYFIEVCIRRIFEGDRS